MFEFETVSVGLGGEFQICIQAAPEYPERPARLKALRRKHTLSPTFNPRTDFVKYCTEVPEVSEAIVVAVVGVGPK